jgi:hypothetical protein
MRPIASATAQARILLCAFQTGDLSAFHAELDKAMTHGVPCSCIDSTEEERWELLNAVTGELRSGLAGTTDICWSLLRHLASSEAPRSAMAVA